MSRIPRIAGSPRWALLLASGLALAAMTQAAITLALTPAPEPKPDAPRAQSKARKKAVAEKNIARHDRMNYGRFLSATIKAPAPPGNDAMKGIAIRVGSNKETEGAVCFDTDLLRVSAGWTGGFLRLEGTAFDGSHGTWPVVKGPQVFGTRQAPGWADPEGGFKDPRPEPFGPLPAAWAKYKGLYRSGDHVVLSYTVGGVPVLEMPGIEAEDQDQPILTRTFNVGPTARPITLVVLDRDGGPGRRADRPADPGGEADRRRAGRRPRRGDLEGRR